MRRRTTALLGLVLGVLASLAGDVRAQPSPDLRRPQPKIITYEPVKENSAVVGVIGQVGRPGTYQFASPPTLDLLVAAADGMTADASESVRLVRGRRVTQTVTYSLVAGERLQSGDLVIIDAKPARSSDRPAEKKFVWLAMVGVTERPLVVACPLADARPDLIVQKLGQHDSILSTVRTHQPPGASPQNAAGAPLADGTVLFFDRSQIEVNQLPDDLPPILPCGLPEPEIGGYGVRNAYEERLQSEPMSSQQSEPPRFNAMIPLPTRDSSEPTPIPLPDESPARISSTKQSAGSPPISTVPYSQGSAPIAARRHRLTGLAPSRQSTAIDTQSPAWKKGTPSANEELTEVASDEQKSQQRAAGAFSGWQMLIIICSVGLIVGLALAARSWPGNTRPQPMVTEPLAPRQPQPMPVAPVAMLHTEAKVPVPPPHVPVQSFVATALPRKNSIAAAATDGLSQRQLAFALLLNHDLPIIEEPLALRPGIPLGSPVAEKSIWRRDAGVSSVEPPASRPSSPPPPASAPRQHLDAPHPRLVSGPHLRIGPEAPVERALRQLQGGRS